MTDDAQDLQLTTEGTWEPYVVFTDADVVTDMEEGLEAKGWETLLTVGSGDACGVEITLYQHRTDPGHPEYLLTVRGEQIGSPFLKVNTLPEAMQLLSQWAPIVQAASISRVVSDLAEGTIEPEGLVETIAARAVWGAQERLPMMKADRERIDREVAARRRAARAAGKP